MQEEERQALREELELVEGTQISYPAICSW